MWPTLCIFDPKSVSRLSESTDSDDRAAAADDAAAAAAYTHGAVLALMWSCLALRWPLELSAYIFI